MNAIVEYINRYRTENPTGWRRWVIGSFVALLTVIVIIVFAVQAAQRNKELAKLKSERDRALESVHRASVNQKLASNKEEAAAHQAAADRALKHAAVIEKEIKQLEDLHRANEAIINSIRSWDDVDKKVK